MENFKNFLVALDKPVYFAGEIVNGTVNFELKNRFHISGLSIKLIGYAKIRWYFFNLKKKLIDD